MRIAALACLVAVAGTPACGGGGEDAITIYLPARLGPEGPPGQIAPVLTPVERDRRGGMSAAWQSVLELRVGPSPDERARGFREGLAAATRLQKIRVENGIATVDFAGEEPTLMASAAAVYTLTELPNITAVSLRLDGEPCCFRFHDGRPVPVTARTHLRGWTGQPCALRAGDDVRCRN